MKTDTIPPVAEFTPSDAETQAVIDKLTMGKPLDPETYRRIRERAEQATAELRRRSGELNIAADLIRETRDEE
jgi:hypothetical protein